MSLAVLIQYSRARVSANISNVSNDAASALSAIKVLAHAHPELSLLVLHGSRARFEAVPGSFDKFWFDAVSFWCDAAPVLRAGYEAVLDGLDR